MSAIRKLGPYVACVVAGVCSGVGVAYLLYIRLNRQIVEIRKLVRELKQEVDTYSDDNQSRKCNKRPRVQYTLTASSGDDDDDFVDCVAGLSDIPADPELVGVRQNMELATAEKSPAGLVFGSEKEGQPTAEDEISGGLVFGNKKEGQPTAEDEISGGLVFGNKKEDQPTAEDEISAGLVFGNKKEDQLITQDEVSDSKTVTLSAELEEKDPDAEMEDEHAS